jgi:hypothetical protein
MYFADRVVFHLVVSIISLYRVEPLEGHKLPIPNSFNYTSKAVQYGPFLEICPAPAKPYLQTADWLRMSFRSSRRKGTTSAEDDFIKRMKIRVLHVALHLIISNESM